jgi:hypothetical protein
LNILAIDPGKSGGLAISSHGETDASKMPDTLKGLADIAQALAIDPSCPTVCYIEDVPKFCGRNRPAASIFTLAESYGAAQGVLAASGIRTIRVRPHVWQKGLSLGKRNDCKNHRAWKMKLKAEAQRRFPALNVTLATADALLLLDYALRQERTQTIPAAINPNPNSTQNPNPENLWP